MQTYKQFFTDVLHKLNLPVTDHALHAFYSVCMAEGLNDRYNPVNSVVPYGDSSPFNSVGVQDYHGYNNGVMGTVALFEGSPWVGVVNAIKRKHTTNTIIKRFRDVYATWGSHPSFPRNDALGDVPLGGGTVHHHQDTHSTGHIPTGDTYTVERGDTLYGIAGKVYGTPGRWPEIAHANHILAPWIIHPGDKLVIP